MDQAPSFAFGAVTPPVVRSSTFTYPTAAAGAARFAGTDGGLLYSRLANPTVQALEARIAEMDGAERTIAFASGMGAIHAALMAHLRPGARLVTDACVYGCTDSLMRDLATWGVHRTAVDTTDLDAVAAAIGNGVDVVFLETPMNPSLRLADIRRIAELTHAAGGLLIVDNTFATALGQKPLELGADLVVYSLTKGMNGHSDLLAGAVSGPSALLDPVWVWLKNAGAVLDADTASLCLRGLQTLEVRLREMNATAEALAASLESLGHDVRHPNLASHPQHGLAEAQMLRGCHVFTLDLGTAEAAMAFSDRLGVFQRAVSLGGFESLVSHPASTTHACLPPEAQEAAGITPGLLRFSVGLEGFDRLSADLQEALHQLAPILAA